MTGMHDRPAHSSGHTRQRADIKAGWKKKKSEPSCSCMRSNKSTGTLKQIHMPRTQRTSNAPPLNAVNFLQAKKKELTQI